MGEEGIGAQVIDAAMRVHTVLGPGLLESVYEAALAVELRKRGLKVEVQKPLPVVYEGVELGLGFRIDLLVENRVLIELKSVETLHPVFLKQTLSYLKLGNYRLGFLLNFNVPPLKDGIKRIVNQLPNSHFNPPASSSSAFPSRSSRPSRDITPRDIEAHA